MHLSLSIFIFHWPFSPIYHEKILGEKGRLFRGRRVLVYRTLVISLGGREMIPFHANYTRCLGNEWGSHNHSVCKRYTSWVIWNDDKSKLVATFAPLLSRRLFDIMRVFWSITEITKEKGQNEWRVNTRENYWMNRLLQNQHLDYSACMCRVSWQLLFPHSVQVFFKEGEGDYVCKWKNKAVVPRACQLHF